MALENFARQVLRRGKSYVDKFRAQKTKVDPAVIASASANDGSHEGPFAHSSAPIDIIISPNEISFAHGTGVLLSRLLEGKHDFIALRSRDDYGGTQTITPIRAHCLPNGVSHRAEVFAVVMKWLGGANVRRIICAPYFESDVTLAIAARAITGAPLGIWVMDDNCIKNPGINRELMKEALEIATARFAISRELRRAYETEFHQSFAVLPPLVAPKMIRSKPVDPLKDAENTFVMIGNLWSGKTLERLSSTIGEAGIDVTWYCENPELWAGDISQKTLKSRGINIVCDKRPDEVQKALEQATVVLLPSDPGNIGPHETALGDMSLPTRLPFIMATSGTPVLVLARPGTAAGNFVKDFGIGEVVPYEAEVLRKALERLAKPKTQKTMRENAARNAEKFSFDGALGFIEAAMDNGGRWPDNRFDAVLPPVEGQYALFVDKPAPTQFADHFSEVIAVCDRLKQAKFEPDWILDIGASTAVWSQAIETVYNSSRYVLCDPMFSRYEKVWSKPHYEMVEAAIGNKEGEITFSVSSDLYGSSIIEVSGIVETVETLTVPMRTVDNIAKEKKLTGRGLMKVDVQFAEHLVIDGATNLLAKQVDVVILELTLPRVNPQAKTLLEMCNRMAALGFRVFDIAGGWRIPATGEMEQADVVFVRDGLKGTLQSTPPE